jgi:hypothetical protein
VLTRCLPAGLEQAGPFACVAMRLDIALSMAVSPRHWPIAHYGDWQLPDGRRADDVAVDPAAAPPLEPERYCGTCVDPRPLGSTVLTESSSRPAYLSCGGYDDLSPASNCPSRIAKAAQRL